MTSYSDNLKFLTTKELDTVLNEAEYGFIDMRTLNERIGFEKILVNQINTHSCIKNGKKLVKTLKDLKPISLQ
jgi:hypothetical protein